MAGLAAQKSTETPKHGSGQNYHLTTVPNIRSAHVRKGVRTKTLLINCVDRERVVTVGIKDYQGLTGHDDRMVSAVNG